MEGSLFKNHQWEVTKYGLEARKPEAPYEIKASRLVEATTRANGEFYDWPVHMAEKNWVDLNAFVEAFQEAIRAHSGRYSPPVDHTKLDASVNEAWRIRRELY